MIGRDAIGQRVRTAGVFGNVAADSAGALAGGIGRVEVAEGLHRERDIQIDHAGLHHRALVLEIDFEDPVHAREADQMPPARGMAPPLRPVPAPRPTMGTPYSRRFSRSPTTSSVVRGNTTIRGGALSTLPSYS